MVKLVGCMGISNDRINLTHCGLVSSDAIQRHRTEPILTSVLLNWITFV